MRCPFCGNLRRNRIPKAGGGRVVEQGERIRRRRQCSTCGRRWSTNERVQTLSVIKRDGREEPFNRRKLSASIRSAAGKHSPAWTAAEELALAISQEAHVRAYAAQNGMTIQSPEIGDLVLARLRQFDPPTHIRYGVSFVRIATATDLLKWAERLDRSGVEMEPFHAPETAARSG